MLSKFFNSYPQRLLLLAVLIVTLGLVTGCGRQVTEDTVLDTWYQISEVPNIKDKEGQPVKMIVVVELGRSDEDENNIKFKQHMYSVGKPGITEATYKGTWDENKHTLTIGTLVPFVYNEKDDTLDWGGDKMIRLTDKTKPELDKALKIALNQRLY